MARSRALRAFLVDRAWQSLRELNKVASLTRRTVSAFFN